MHLSVDPWNHNRRRVQELLVCRVSEVFIIDINGAKPLDQRH
jgi:hypothetical protein